MQYLLNGIIQNNFVSLIDQINYISFGLIINEQIIQNDKKKNKCCDECIKKQKLYYEKTKDGKCPSCKHNKKDHPNKFSNKKKSCDDCLLKKKIMYENSKNGKCHSWKNNKKNIPREERTDKQNVVVGTHQNAHQVRNNQPDKANYSGHGNRNSGKPPPCCACRRVCWFVVWCFPLRCRRSWPVCAWHSPPAGPRCWRSSCWPPVKASAIWWSGRGSCSCSTSSSCALWWSAWSTGRWRDMWSASLTKRKAERRNNYSRHQTITRDKERTRERNVGYAQRM